MVEVFKTNVSEESQSALLVCALKRQFPDSLINFDLEDCDKILRIEAKSLNPDEVMQCLQLSGYHCELLD